MDEQTFHVAVALDEMAFRIDSEMDRHEAAAPFSPVLLEAHRTYLRRLAADLINPELRAKVSASDLVQESMLSAYRNYATYRGNSPEDLRNWLEGILRNKYLDVMRKFYKSGKSSLEKEISIDANVGWDLPDPKHRQESAVNDMNDRIDLMIAEISKLPAIERTLIEKKMVGKLKMNEIARQLGMTPDCAHKRYQRAMKILHDRLSARFAEF